MNIDYFIYKDFILELVEEYGYIVSIKKASSIKQVKPSIYLNDLKKQLDEYFNKQRESFDIIYKQDGTIFEIMVWEALKKIPYGSTKTYKEIACMINRPFAYRAVGNACNKNKLMILIPCHRVVGVNSKGGFKWGEHLKEELLTLERSTYDDRKIY